MYEQITILGNLGRAPEMRYTPQGTAVSTFQVATSRKWLDAQGDLHEETKWWRVSTFGKQAENCNQYLDKGSKVLVTGELVADPKTGGPRVYTRKDGTAGAAFELRANNVRFLGRPANAAQNNDDGSEYVPRVNSTMEHGDAEMQHGGAMSEENLPF